MEYQENVDTIQLPYVKKHKQKAETAASLGFLCIIALTTISSSAC